MFDSAFSFKLILCTLIVLTLSACKEEFVITHTTYEIYNCKQYVNLREKPNTKSKSLAKLHKGLKLDTAIYYGNNWYTVTTLDNKTGYVQAQYVNEIQHRREKTDYDDLVEHNQKLTIKAIDMATMPKQPAPTGVFILLVVAAIVTSILFFVQLDVGCDNWLRWVTYVLLIVDACILTYTLHYYKFDNFDVHWLIDIAVFILCCTFVFSLWGLLMMHTSILCETNKVESIHTCGNVAMCIVVLICGYWIESWTDIVLVIWGVFNVCFLLFYLISGIIKRNFLSSLLLSILWIVCLIPVSVASLMLFYVVFIIACAIASLMFVLLMISTPSGGGGGRSSGYRELKDENGITVDKIDSDGNSEYGGRHYSRDSDGSYTQDY